MSASLQFTSSQKLKSDYDRPLHTPAIEERVTSATSEQTAQLEQQVYFFICYEPLACFLGSGDMALIIQRLHYWLENEKSGYLFRDGRKRVYNGYIELTQQLTWLSVDQIGRMIRHLEEIGWLVSDRFYNLKRNVGFVGPVPQMHEDNQRKWYYLDYQKIYEDTGFDLLRGKTPQAKPPKRARRANLQNHRFHSAKLQLPICNFADSSISKDFQNNSQSLPHDKKEIFQSTSATVEPGLPSNQMTVDSPTADVCEDLSQTLVNSLSVDSRTEGLSVEIHSSPPPGNKNLQSLQRQKFVWEVAVGEPYPAFLNWRYQTHYKPQGGRWETGGSKFAYSEFYKDPRATTATLYRDFLDYIHRATENANQLAAAGMDVILPSVLADRKPAPTEENTQQLMHNVQHLVNEHDAKVALPQSVATPSCRQAITWEEATNSDTAPLPTLTPASAPILPAAEADAADQERVKLAQKVKRQRASWKALPNPRFREIIQKWAEETPGVVMTEDGPQLESAVNHPTQEVSAEAPAQEISAQEGEAINSVNNHATPLEEPSISPYLGNPDPADFTPPPDPWDDSAEVDSQLESGYIGKLIECDSQPLGFPPTPPHW